MIDCSPDPRSQAMAEKCDALATRFRVGAQTTAELRAIITEELGEHHPIARFVEDWPTVEEAKTTMKAGLHLFDLRQVEDGGRAGMLAALEGALEFLHASLPPSDLSLLRPLTHLQSALIDLEATGHQARCLRAKGRGPADSIATATFKARALAISDLIMVEKETSLEQADMEAASKVSRRARALGVAPRVVVQDLESWRRNARSRRQRQALNLMQRAARVVSIQVERLAPMFRTGRRLDLAGLIRAILREERP